MHRALRPGSFTFLLICLGIVLFGTPFSTHDRAAFDITDLILPALIISGVYALSRRRLHLMIGIGLALVAFIGRGVALAQPAGWSARTLGILDYATDLPILAFLTAMVFTRVVRSADVNWDTISGSICVYLLIGAIWAELYALTVATDPTAFTFTVDPPADISRLGLMMYFSFVTLTTLGYGDVLPHSHMARSLASLEAVIGPLYLTIMIARLVGLHISQPPPAHKP